MNQWKKENEWIKNLQRFGHIEIEKGNFYYSKYPINIDNLDVDKVISYKFYFDKKGFLYLLVTKMLKKLTYYV